MKNTVNIINFVRGIEPRPRDMDLYKPVREQIRLLRENNLRGTFLLQYDTMLDSEFLSYFENYEEFCELGVWIEIVEPLVTKIGEEWRGRYPWDWHNDVGFLIGYTPDVRLRLIDKLMEKFKELFGYYPRSVGSWHIDAVSMKYLCEKYNVDACCICRDQVGIDGYTMQGGYYNQAYYPSVYNMFCPAQTLENQINMPVFRMLGSDMIYAYDYQTVDYGTDRCSTLEPVSFIGGGNPKWCDYFFSELFDGSGVSFQYTQVGQENSFGWPRMGEGLEYQHKLVKQYADDGLIEVKTLSESGRDYKESFKTTPVATVKSLSDVMNDDRFKSVWYYSSQYRVSLLWDNGKVRIRDIYVFDENYKEHYYDKACKTTACEFRNLPVMDSAIYTKSKKDTPAGIYFEDANGVIKWDNMTYSESGDTVTVVLSNAEGHAVITLNPSSFAIDCNMADFKLVTVYDKNNALGVSKNAFGNHNNSTTTISHIKYAKVQNGKVNFSFDGFDYSINVAKGTVTDSYEVIPDTGKIEIQF